MVKQGWMDCRLDHHQDRRAGRHLRMDGGSLDPKIPVARLKQWALDLGGRPEVSGSVEARGDHRRDHQAGFCQGRSWRAPVLCHLDQ